jgi:hypothetical protein
MRKARENRLAVAPETSATDRRWRVWRQFLIGRQSFLKFPLAEQGVND